MWCLQRTLKWFRKKTKWERRSKKMRQNGNEWWVLAKVIHFNKINHYTIQGMFIVKCNKFRSWQSKASQIHRRDDGINLPSPILPAKSDWTLYVKQTQKDVESRKARCFRPPGTAWWFSFCLECPSLGGKEISNLETPQTQPQQKPALSSRKGRA